MLLGALLSCSASSSSVVGVGPVGATIEGDSVGGCGGCKGIKERHKSETLELNQTKDTPSWWPIVPGVKLTQIVHSRMKFGSEAYTRLVIVPLKPAHIPVPPNTTLGGCSSPKPNPNLATNE